MKVLPTAVVVATPVDVVAAEEEEPGRIRDVHFAQLNSKQKMAFFAFHQNLFTAGVLNTSDDTAEWSPYSRLKPFNLRLNLQYAVLAIAIYIINNYYRQ